MGRNYKNAATPQVGSKPAKPAPAPAPRPTAEESDDDEEEGRSSLGKSKRAKLSNARNDSFDTSSRKKKRSGNYLDEVLSQRKKKKNK